MYAQLVLIGSGTEGDPYRVNHPNCQTISVDYDAGIAIVSIGPRDAPSNLPPLGSPSYPQIGDKFVLVSLPAEDVTAWWAKLAGRYPGHEPPYTPAFAVL